jgi:hypothetical protein
MRDDGIIQRNNGSGDGLHRCAIDEQEASELSTAELIKELARHTKELVRDEVRLVKLELTEEQKQLKAVGGEGKTLVSDTSTRLRGELSAARADMHEATHRVKKAVVPMSVGGVLLHATLFLALFTLVFVIDLVLPLWAAALIVTVVTGLVGFILAKTGAREAKELTQNPFGRTTRLLKEDKRWIGTSLKGLKTRLAGTLRDAKSRVSESVSRRSQVS